MRSSVLTDIHGFTLSGDMEALRKILSGCEIYGDIKPIDCTIKPPTTQKKKEKGIISRLFK